MLIELKDFQFYPELTDETNAFSAKLLVNKQEAAHCVNRGNAETEIRIIDKNTYALYREYIKKASEEFSEVVKGGLVTEAGYVETLASGYIYKEYAKKKKAKIRSLCRYSIVYADRKHSMNLRQISFYSDSEAEKKEPIQQLLKDPDMRNTLLQRIAELKAEGKYVFNKNIR